MGVGGNVRVDTMGWWRLSAGLDEWNSHDSSCIQVNLTKNVMNHCDSSQSQVNLTKFHKSS